jgi:DNA-binding response OmpR family regulator
MNSARVLVIEDERHIAEGLKLNLELAGHSVELATNGRIGLEKWQSFKPDLIILDIMMPELDGHGVLQKIRSVDLRLPILILSAKNASVDKVKAFKGGVDDYLGKPFSLEELMLRVGRLLVRSQWNSANREHSNEFEVEPVQQYSFGSNDVDLIKMKAHTKNGELDLTEQEVKVLELFFSKPAVPLKREEILEVGWGYGADVNTRTLDNFMVRFRKYFEENPKKPKYFCSVRGVGYLFSPEGKGR